MTKQELRKEINKLTSEYKAACRKLRIQYALENNSVKVGDIIAQNSFPKTKIVVKEIKIPDYDSFGTPECLYVGNVISSTTGEELDTVKHMYQSFIDEINGVPYKYEVK